MLGVYIERSMSTHWPRITAAIACHSDHCKVVHSIFTPLKTGPGRQAKVLLSPLFWMIVCHTKGLLSSHDSWTEPSCTGPEK